MSKIDSLSFKEHLNQFVHLDDHEYQKLLSYFKHQEFKKHRTLIQENEYVRFTYWVQKGLILSTFSDKEGREHIIQFALENCWITDQDAFYNGVKSKFRITCIEDTEVFALSFEARENLCKEMPKIEQFFRRKANDSFVKQQKRLLTYLTSNAQERFELLIQEYPSLLQRISKKKIAAYLGVSRETLSRLSKT